MTIYTTQCVLHWCILLEEFGPEFFYKKGPDNAVTGALSHVPTSQTDIDDSNLHYQSTEHCPYDILVNDPEPALALSYHPTLEQLPHDSLMQLPIFDQHNIFDQLFHFKTI